MSDYYRISNELYHHGVLGMKWGIRRYQPYSSGKRVEGGKEVGEAAKAAKKAERKEKIKKAAKTTLSLAGKAALTGATVAAKVVFSSAITSATLVGMGVAGYNFITSPPVQSIMQKTAIKAGEWLFDKYLNVGAQTVNENYDYYYTQGSAYLESLMKELQ